MARAMGPATTSRLPSLLIVLPILLCSIPLPECPAANYAIAQTGGPVHAGRGGGGGGGVGGGGGADVRTIALWAGAMIALLVVGAATLVLLHRRILGDAHLTPGEALSLHDLRLLRQRGEMSDEEFESAKAAILGHPKGVRRAPEGFDLTGEPLPTHDAQRTPKIGPS